MKKNISAPLVSIMMPVYNGRRLIEASIESLINQSYTNWECIIVDDGSTDGTSEFLKTLNARDNRFKIITFKNNQGRPVARQRALDEAKGKYLAMLDAEDLYHPDKLKLQVEILEAMNEIALVSGGMISFGSFTGLLRKRGARKDETIEYNGKNKPIFASSMLRMERAKKCSFNPSLKFGEDAYFLKQYLENTSFYSQYETLYYYSEFDSVTKSKILKTNINMFKYCLKQKKYKDTFNFILSFPKLFIGLSLLPLSKILERRGYMPSAAEIHYFNNQILPIIKNSCKK